MANILVIGYFDKQNLGDEAYKLVMGNFFPGDTLTFVGSDKLASVERFSYDAVVVGGGDIINDYFNRHISSFLHVFKKPKIAFSIGIPFPDLIIDKYMGFFDHVFTRNMEDVRRIQQLLGANRAHYIPDITLTLPFKKQVKVETEEKKCGVFLIGNVMEFPFITDDLSHLIGKLALTYKMIFYCFNPTEDMDISNYIIKESKIRIENSETGNDRMKELLEKAKDPSRFSVYQTKDVPDMLEQIGGLDFAVCMRYHSHIFCTIANVPFISISTTRKTRSLMKTIGIADYQYEVELNSSGTPIASDYTKMKEVCRIALRDEEMITEKLQIFLEDSLFLLESRQASKLLHYNGDIKNIHDFYESTHDAANTARLISSRTLGFPDSGFNYGILEKLLTKDADVKQVISNSLKHLFDNGIKFTKELVAFEKGIPVNVDISEYQSYKDVHRGGWYIACNYLANAGLDGGIICDMYVDRTFHWAKNYMLYTGKIPYSSPWCGFIHHTNDVTYSDYNSDKLFVIPEFLQSLEMCRALFVLNSNVRDFILKKLVEIGRDIPVYCLDHPVDKPYKKFSLRKYYSNDEPRLINIGAWLRNPFTIYILEGIQIQKTILIGKDMNSYKAPDGFKIIPFTGTTGSSSTGTSGTACNTPCRPEHGKGSKWIYYACEWIEKQGCHVMDITPNTIAILEAARIPQLMQQINIAAVNVLPYQDNRHYDDLLSRNVVFLNLEDAGAVNTIIECKVRRTPVIVNKIPGTVNLLGADYPLFYNDVSEVAGLLTTEKLRDAFLYMKKLDVSKYDIQKFIDVFSNLIINVTE